MKNRKVIRPNSPKNSNPPVGRRPVHHPPPPTPRLRPQHHLRALRPRSLASISASCSQSSSVGTSLTRE